FASSLTLQVINMPMRMSFTAPIYGWRFASLAPLRACVGNVINSLASASAVYRYSRAKWSGQPMGWLKTDHAYPNRLLGEILVGSNYLAAAELEEALATQPQGVRIGEHLVQCGKLTERDLFESLSLQQDLAFQILD